jgi:DNA-binding MarR family transcriptional regulator
MRVRGMCPGLRGRLPRQMTESGVSWFTPGKQLSYDNLSRLGDGGSMPSRRPSPSRSSAEHPGTSPGLPGADARPRHDEGNGTDPADRPLGARDDLDVALLRLHRLALAATVRAGNESSPPVTPTQIRVLTLLAASPDGMPLSAIAESLFVSPPSASRLCQRLVRDGLVTRSAGPGHYILIALSAEGARVLRALNQARVTPLRQLIDALSPRRRAAAIAQLTELGRQAGDRHDAW